MKTVDVLIVGGGMAGSALAFSLASCRSKKYRVTVLEKHVKEAVQDRVGESLPAAALRSLHTLGLSKVIDPAKHAGYHGVVSSWGQSTPIRKDFLSTLEGSGLHVNRGLLNQNIRQAATNAGVEFIFDTKLVSLSRIAENWHALLLTANKKQQIVARLIIDASGRANAVGRKLGVKRINLDRAIAVHTRLSKQSQHNGAGLKGVTLIEAVEGGWWYRAPLPSGDSVVSFHTDSDLHPARSMQCSANWLESLRATKLISKDLKIDEIEEFELTVCAANTSVPQSCSGDGWLAIGDAAIGFDPISSQGMFNALTTPLLAKPVITEMLEGNSKAAETYSSQINNVRNAYQRNLNEFYQSEMRWPQSSFWKRRHADILYGV